MQLKKRSSLTEGSLKHTIEFDGESEFDRVEISHLADHEGRMVCECYKNDDMMYRTVIETRDLAFDPVSVLSTQDSEKLLGTSLVNDDGLGNLPSELLTAFNTLGMAVVPQGEWWLHG